MSRNNLSFEYGRKDGTLLSEEQFFQEHDISRLTSSQQKRLLENLEVQAFAFLKECKGKTKFNLTDFCRKFVFIESKTKEMYFKPILEIKVFFKEFPPIILIYDMRLPKCRD